MSDEERALFQKKIDDEKASAEAARQVKIEEATKLIAKMDITCSTDMPKPLAPGTVGKGKIEVETNLFGIRMNDDYAIFKYDIDITCDTGRQRILEFTRKGRSDHVASDRKMTCITIFAKAIKETGCYRDDIVFFYDGQSIMFTTEKLLFKDGKRYYTVVLDGGTISQDLAGFKVMNFVIKECTDRFQSKLSDIRKIDRDIVTKDRSAMQFVDVATSMYALSQSEHRFTVFANGKIFPNHPEREGIQTVGMKEGKELIPGLSKSIKLVEGPKGRHNASPALAIDSLKVAFHVKQNLIDKAKSVFVNVSKPTENEIKSFSDMVRGLGCNTTHLTKQRTVEIFLVSKENSSKKLEIEMNGVSKTVTVGGYYKEKYDIDLKYPLAPLVVHKQGPHLTYYPMELLDVIPMQRVTIPQTTPAQSQVATKECAVPPGTRQNAIIAQCNLHDMFNPDQPYLKAAGIEIIAQPLRAAGRVLKGPVLKYKNNEMEVLQSPWRPPQNHQFIVPASCERWGMYGILSPKDSFDIKKFAEQFVKRCRERGMQMAPPMVVNILPAAPQEKTVDYPARMVVKDAAYHNVQFVFFITNDNIAIHNHIKLEESYSNVVTQDLKLSTALNVIQKNQSITLDNIVFKTNVKLGGVNYSLNLKNVVGPNIDPFIASRLIVGIGISHAPACESYLSKSGVKLPAPSVVGYCANMANQPTEYIGDFLYQDGKKDDLLLCIPEMMQNILDRFTGKVNPDGSRIVLGEGQPPPKPLPKELIVYRQGVGEGYYSMCIQEEIPLVKAVLASNGAKACKVTYVVVQKEHNVRLMPVKINTADKATQQNIASGVVIDSQLTHPRNREFFLNSHNTLQGTARTPRYTVLHDDSDLTMNELESITHGLAFNFQIVNSPVSIPSPLYIANRYAERGAAIFAAKLTDEMASSNQKTRISLAEMNEDLTYSHKGIGGVRINA